MTRLSRGGLRHHVDEATLPQGSRRDARGGADRYADLRSYCMFIGYPRSGHSLVGALLDAHPQTVIAHELDALKYVDLGYSRRRLFELIEDNASRSARLGREQTGYSYAVPGAHQGQWQTLRVIGDKKGGRSTLWLAEKPELLEALRRTVGVPLRVVHIVRNPYDMIATIVRHDAERRRVARADDLDRSIERVGGLARSVERSITRLAPDEIWHARHEDFVQDPQRLLAELCRFVGVEPSIDYLRACAAIVYTSPNRSRDAVTWGAHQRDQVEGIIASHTFFQGYSRDR